MKNKLIIVAAGFLLNYKKMLSLIQINKTQ